MNEQATIFPLDPMQRRAVDADEGVSVVIGATGTGKTHVLIGRVAHLLESGVDPGHITCLTVQVEGAAHLRGRLASHPRIRGRLESIFVGGLHDYARVFLRLAGARVLGRSPDFTVWDRRRAVEAVRVAWPHHHTDPVRKQVIVDGLDWYWRNRSLLPYEPPYPAVDGSWLDVEALYKAEKAAQNAVDYTDLLVMAAGAMDQDRHVKDDWRSTRSRHLLVDQAEDLTPRQFMFVEQLACPMGSLTIAADPNVGLLHHSPDAAVELLRLAYPNRRLHVLQLDQVSTRQLTDVTRTLQRDAGDVRGLWDHGQVNDGVDGSTPVLAEVEGTLREMYTHCLDEASRLAENGIPWGDMAILYRRQKVHRQLATHLVYRDIPYSVLGNVRGDKPGDARLVVALLTCLLHPADLDSVRIAAAPGHPNRDRRLRLASSRRLLSLARDSGMDLMEAAKWHLEALDEDDPDRHGLSWLIRIWAELHETLVDPRCDVLDLVQMAHHKVVEMQPPGLTLVDDPETSEFIRLCAATPRDRGDTPRMHLQKVLDLWPLGRDAVTPRPTERRVLTLSPIHAAKGLRWPVVFVLDVSDQTMPGKKVGDYSDQLHWERRVFYTAVTRATRCLYLYCLSDTGMGATVTPTRFLDPIIHLLERRYVERQDVWTRDRIDSGLE